LCDSRFGAESWIETIETRLTEHWPRFFGLLHRLYGHHYDFFYYLENIALTAIDCWLERPDDLYELDPPRERSGLVSLRADGRRVAVRGSVRRRPGPAARAHPLFQGRSA
jgi:hypothetical protein